MAPPAFCELQSAVEAGQGGTGPPASSSRKKTSVSAGIIATMVIATAATKILSSQGTQTVTVAPATTTSKSSEAAVTEVTEVPAEVPASTTTSQAKLDPPQSTRGGVDKGRRRFRRALPEATNEVTTTTSRAPTKASPLWRCNDTQWENDTGIVGGLQLVSCDLPDLGGWMFLGQFDLCEKYTNQSYDEIDLETCDKAAVAHETKLCKFNHNQCDLNNGDSCNVFCMTGYYDQGLKSAIDNDDEAVNFTEYDYEYNSQACQENYKLPRTHGENATNQALMANVSQWGFNSGCFDGTECLHTDNFTTFEVEKCQQVCANLPECMFWSWGIKGECLLRTNDWGVGEWDVANAADAADWTSGHVDCKPHKCMCENGTAATGSACNRNDEHICRSCNDGFSLVADTKCEVASSAGEVSAMSAAQLTPL